MFRESSTYSNAIGVFDSGIGGLTVMKQMITVMPNENMIYFGDTARVPYGEKSPETIIRYSIENAIFLMEYNIKVLVVACNTASAYALVKLQHLFKIPVVGVIESGVDKAVAVTRNQRIAVLGTKGTIKSNVYQQEIKRRLPNALVQGIACPLFVPLVEERFVSHPATKILVKEYLAPFKDQGIDTILLGCTHYPLLRQVIQDELGSGVEIVDSASTCAEKVSAILTEQRLHNQNSCEAIHRYFVSDDAEKFRLAGSEFLGSPIPHVGCHTFHK